VRGVDWVYTGMIQDRSTWTPSDFFFQGRQPGNVLRNSYLSCLRIIFRMALELCVCTWNTDGATFRNNFKFFILITFQIYISFEKLMGSVRCIAPFSRKPCRSVVIFCEHTVTDFINALPGNRSVNTVQHATTDEAVFLCRPHYAQSW
jgi:hypothetical protein